MYDGRAAANTNAVTGWRRYGCVITLWKQNAEKSGDSNQSRCRHLTGPAFNATCITGMLQAVSGKSKTFFIGGFYNLLQRTHVPQSSTSWLASSFKKYSLHFLTLFLIFAGLLLFDKSF